MQKILIKIIKILKEKNLAGDISSFGNGYRIKIPGIILNMAEELVNEITGEHIKLGRIDFSYSEHTTTLYLKGLG